MNLAIRKRETERKRKRERRIRTTKRTEREDRASAGLARVGRLLRQSAAAGAVTLRVGTIALKEKGGQRWHSAALHLRTRQGGPKHSGRHFVVTAGVA